MSVCVGPGFFLRGGVVGSQWLLAFVSWRTQVLIPRGCQRSPSDRNCQATPGSGAGGAGKKAGCDASFIHNPTRPQFSEPPIKKTPAVSHTFHFISEPGNLTLQANPPSHLSHHPAHPSRQISRHTQVTPSQVKTPHHSLRQPDTGAPPPPCSTARTVPWEPWNQH